ncbi:hypothetical protein [Nonomuraea sp. NPDC049158]|uniref:hypothetical protein n=1 Tax=Nonomuraea sp. NPDC049158 TaxID=3155649 RepID=UPI0033C59D3D
MRFAVLGPVRLWRGDVELNAGPPQQRALFALLLAYAGRPVSLEEMVDVLWAQDPPVSCVPPNRVPVAMDARVGLYRSLLAERRVLILLDNARDADQVRPLLPGSPGCLVLITSRDRLPGLVATEGAFPMTLDLFPVEDARGAGRLRGRRSGH